jgi:hypothetical protein
MIRQGLEQEATKSDAQAGDKGAALAATIGDAVSSAVDSAFRGAKPKTAEQLIAEGLNPTPSVAQGLQ